MSCEPLQPRWEFVADTVMGGVSTGQVTEVQDGGWSGARLTGSVSLENNGGFIQMAFDLGGDTGVYDASGYRGLSFDVRGDGSDYAVNLRTTDLSRPWQSYRAIFSTTAEWKRIEVPFTSFRPSNTDVPLNPARLRRIGIIAVGRAMAVDVTIANICLTR